MKDRSKGKIEKMTEWMGSVPSLAVHTLAFIAAFAVGVFSVAPWDMVLLVLTTAVSLEAIYLAIFIQMTVNRQSIELQEVSEDVEVIQKEVEEIGDDVEDIQEDVEEITEEEKEAEMRELKQAVTMETLAHDMQRILVEIEGLKKK